MTGFASKRAMSNRQSPPNGWRECLDIWQQQARKQYGWADYHNVISDCMDAMQEFYPGKYVLEFRETSPMTWQLVPVFADPKHETMWKLKYEC